MKQLTNSPTTDSPKRTGGLYAKVNMSVKSANIMVAVLVVLLVAVSVFVVHNNGFTVRFDTDGGSYIEPIRVMYSDKISVDDPVREGYEFTGWYTDRALTNKWNASADTVTGSMTLYAGWK